MHFYHEKVSMVLPGSPGEPGPQGLLGIKGQSGAHGEVRQSVCHMIIEHTEKILTCLRDFVVSLFFIKGLFVSCSWRY